MCSNAFSAMYLCSAGKSKTTADFCFLPLLEPPIKTGNQFALQNQKFYLHYHIEVQELV